MPLDCRARPMKVSLAKLTVPPPARFRPALDLLRWYFAPEYLHLDRADKRRPTLFVGNHSLYGVLDVLLFADGLYRERGIVLRSLADRNHFKVPLWRDFVEQTGAVHGTRANCAALMRRGEHILVFPGGAREVFKHQGEAYRLIWKERFGFVRLAIEHGYTITPYATAGAEEAFDVLLDSSDYMNTPLGPARRRRVSAAGAWARVHGIAAAREAVLPGGSANRHGQVPRPGRRPRGAAASQESRGPVARAADRRSAGASGAGARTGAGRPARNAESAVVVAARRSAPQQPDHQAQHHAHDDHRGERRMKRESRPVDAPLVCAPPPSGG